MGRTISMVHAADFHLGSGFGTFPRDKQALLSDELNRAFLATISYVKDHDIALLLIAGDLFDKSNISDSTKKMVIDAFSSIPNTKICISPGNHDPYTVDSPYAMETWPSNVYIFTKREWTYIDFDDLGVRVWGVAFCTNRERTSLCPSGFSVKSSSVDGFATENIDILLVHGDLYSGTKKQSDYNLIMKDFIAESGADYCALGHVHNRTLPARTGRTYYAYSGCPQGRGYDETEECGIFAGTIEKGKVNLSFVPMNQRTFHAISISVDGAQTDQNVEECVMADLKGKYSDVLRRDAFRITLTGDVPVPFTPNLVALKARLDEILFTSRLYDNTTSRKDADEIAKEETLRGAFVRTLLKSRTEAVAKGKTDDMDKIDLAMTIGLRAFEGQVTYHEAD